jgi:hypothetical protein
VTDPKAQRDDPKDDDLIDDEIAASFPASDPPTWTSTHAGPPDGEHVQDAFQGANEGGISSQGS